MLRKIYSQQTVEMGNPMPDPQPKPPQPIARIGPQGPPRNNSSCFRGQFGEYEKPEG